ncbi:protein HEG homolog 1 [Hyperolius riggenbachi]|uniref:protein HEG homolog 1 n=1 Tax=Hyperolius riggenbachi TaxID=752182 RepID=UPI0035A39530
MIRLLLLLLAATVGTPIITGASSIGGSPTVTPLYSTEETPSISTRGTPIQPEPGGAAASLHTAQPPGPDRGSEAHRTDPSPGEGTEPMSEQTEPNARTQPDTRTQPPEPKTRTQPEPNTRNQPEPDTRTQPPEPNTRTQPGPNTRTQPELNTRTQPEPNTRTQPEPNTRTQQVPNTRTQPELNSESQPEPNTRTQPELNTRTQPGPDKTENSSLSEPPRTKAGPSLVSDAKARTAAEPVMGRQKSNLWNNVQTEPDLTQKSNLWNNVQTEPDLTQKSNLWNNVQTEPDLTQKSNLWNNVQTEPDLTQPNAQTQFAFVITQKSVTRRHISKRTPHTGATDLSTPSAQRGNQTFLSVINETNMSEITENPTTYRSQSDSGPTNADTEDAGSATEDSGNKTLNLRGRTQVMVTRGKDSGNTTQDSVTISQDFGNSTGTLGTEEGTSESESSSPITYPLPTPSYQTTTYPSPTSHHTLESSSSFTSIPVTAPNTTSNVTGTDVPANEATVLPSSPSNTSSSSIYFSLSTLPSAVPTTESPPTANTDTVSTSSSSYVSSSSPILSTLVFSQFFTSFTAPSVGSPELTSTSFSDSQTTLLNTTPALPSLSSIPSRPPSLLTTSSFAVTMDTSTPSKTSEPPAATEAPTEVHNGSMTTYKESYSTGTESPGRFPNTIATTIKDSTTIKPILETETLMTSVEDRGGQNVTVVTQLYKTPAQPTNPTSSATSNNLLTPSQHFSTQAPSQENMETTTSAGPALTTGDSIEQVTTNKTTSVDLKTVMPNIGNTISTTGKKIPPNTTLPPAVITLKYSTTTATNPPVLVVPTRPTPPAPANLCSPNPCHNGGTCTERGQHRGYRCECASGWQGRQCDADVDECLSSPCPPQTKCVNLRGSFRCHCPLGYILEKGASCVQVRTFLGHIEIPRSFLNGSNGNYTKLQQIEEEIVHFLNSSFSVIGGYYQSSVMNSSYSSRIVLSIQNIFSLSSNVTIYDLKHSSERYIKVCKSAKQPPPVCQLVLHPQFYYIAISLCSLQNPGCDNETAECVDPAGIAYCQCKAGYFKYSRSDHSCRACDDGYKLQNGVCVRCSFGLGGFNCSNPYQLITIIIAAGGGGLLLILGITLAITCCRKSKHDISKLIFKSGDFQMSPYAEYPKAQRSSEWGRETIEMQENGSTKNLLQMTDVYYSPGLRNPDMERNGLYPYAGVPGSRHSCIYPGQYNPTFINEENRRRDYF